MSEVARLAAAHRRAQALEARRIAAAILALWDLVDLADLAASWAAVSDRASQAVALGQYRAARSGVDYLAALAELFGLDSTDAPTVDPRAFSGVAADGRSLASLLIGGIVNAKTGIAGGLSGPDALTRGAAWLSMTAANEVQQAGRNADHVGITANRNFQGYVRMLQPPSCGRCAILAGKWFGWNQGFARHPQCDCVHVPAAESSGVRDLRTDPRDFFDSLSTADQAKFAGSQAGAQAIRDGADPSQVVNVYAKRNRRTEVNGSTYAPNSGLREFEVLGRRTQYTNEGANVLRGRYGRASGAATGQTDQFQRRQNGRYPKPDQFELADVKRLTPRAIYQIAAGDRDRVIDLLRRYGYLT